MRFVPALFLLSGCSFAGTAWHSSTGEVVFEVEDAVYVIETPDGATEPRFRVLLTSYEDACDAPDPTGIYADAHRIDIVWPDVPDEYESPYPDEATYGYVATGSDCAVAPEGGEQDPFFENVAVGTFIHVIDEEKGVAEGWYHGNSEQFVKGTFNATRCDALAPAPTTPSCGEAP